MNNIKYEITKCCIKIAAGVCTILLTVFVIGENGCKIKKLHNLEKKVAEENKIKFK